MIAIIGLLMAILMPALSKIKDMARMTLCANNQKQIGIAAGTYAAENDTHMPPPPAKSGRPSVLNRWQNDTKVYPYLGSYLPLAKTFNCPVSSFAEFDFMVGGGTYEYQYLYEHPEFCNQNEFNLNCSYLLLWNYSFNSSVSERPFTGPGKDSNVKLLTCDVFMFTNNLGSQGTVVQNRWASTHKFKTQNRRNKDDMYFPYFYWESGTFSETDISNFSELQEVKLMAGYTDGSVTKFASGDTYQMQRVANYASYRIPRHLY